MQGLELSRGYFETYGMPMLKEQFPALIPLLAAGLCGSGSECLGYDDEHSRDHDFEPGFVLFLPGEDVIDRRTAFLLERSYAKLPKEYMGISRSLMAPAGGPRLGVIRTADFFTARTGTPDGSLTDAQWMQLPQQSLLEATNGELFFDNPGDVTAIRDALQYYPEPIRLKKLASNLLLMAQSGQYNYQRCLIHGEESAAQLAVCAFVKSTINVLFLLNRQYQPYYKWTFRALRSLPKLSLLAELLDYLQTTDNTPEMAKEKASVMEGIASDVIDELMEQSLTDAICQDLEKHAYSVNDRIEDGSLRNLHILAGVNEDGVL